MQRFPLITRLAIALLLLTALALGSISSALLLSSHIEGDAKAINLAGSLRMTAYRILANEREPSATMPVGAVEYWRIDFLERLYHPNMSAAIPTAAKHPVAMAYRQVMSEWHQSPLSDPQSTTTTQAADDMVATIDNLVRAMEYESEQNLALLRLTGWGFAGTALILVIGIAIWFFRSVAVPLRQLSEQADALSSQQWEVRSSLKQQDELGNLSRRLDTMAAELAVSYAEMQSQIHERTRHLVDAQSRSALLNERAAIARELHDSLAQTLTYQKIQLTLLNNELQQAPIATDIWQPALENLRNNINDGYRQLRELLVTFRLPLNHNGLDEALRSTLEEMNQQGTTLINCSGNFSAANLQADQEVHVLHIIREALLNVIRHSEADQAEVRIVATANNVTVEILDNGIGLRQSDDPDRPRSQHFGLQMLQERAQQLQGTLSVNSRDGKPGTAVTLTFPLNTAHDAKERITHE